MENEKAIPSRWYGAELPPMDSTETFFAGKLRVWTSYFSAGTLAEKIFRCDGKTFELLARWYWNEALKRAIRRGSGTVSWEDLPGTEEAKARLEESYRD